MISCHAQPCSSSSGTDAKHGGDPAQTNPSSGLSGPGSGTAAIGETSTYSSHTLRKGDEVPSVIDPKSSDPTSYQMPEHSYTSSKGVPEGGPLAAAAAAFHKDRDYSSTFGDYMIMKHATDGI